MPPIKAGELNLKISMFHRVEPNIYDDNEWHEHSHYELQLISRGAIQYRFESCSTLLEENDLILIPPGTRHCWRQMRYPLRMNGFHLAISGPHDQHDRFLDLVDQIAIRHRYRFPAEPRLTALSRNIEQELFDAPPFFEDNLRLLFQLFLLKFTQTCLAEILRLPSAADDEPEESHFRDHLLNSVITYIDDNLNRPISLDNLATFCGISARHLNRIFHSRHQMPVGQYVIQRKIEHAGRLLRQTELNIRQVAVQTGYPDVNYFCRQFKQITGRTPGEFRRSPEKE